MAELAEVIAATEAYAKRMFKDDERVSLAVVLAWYYWRQAQKPELPASVWARVAVRHVFAGRDLPGVQTSHRQDALDHATQGAGMGQVMDRRPGPLQVVMMREECEAWVNRLPRNLRAMADAAREGIVRTKDLAEHLNLSPGRISQMRQEAKGLYGE